MRRYVPGVHSVGRLIASHCLSASKLVVQLDSCLPYISGFPQVRENWKTQGIWVVSERVKDFLEKSENKKKMVSPDVSFSG